MIAAGATLRACSTSATNESSAIARCAHVSRRVRASASRINAGSTAPASTGQSRTEVRAHSTRYAVSGSSDQRSTKSGSATPNGVQSIARSTAPKKIRRPRGATPRSGSSMQPAITGASTTLACTFAQSATTGIAHRRARPVRSASSRKRASSGHAATCGRTPNDSSSAMPPNTVAQPAMRPAPSAAARSAKRTTAAAAQAASANRNSRSSPWLAHQASAVPNSHSCGIQGACGAV